jgi:hypothetical protein
MLHGKEELLITFLDGFALKGGLISFYISNLSIEKAVLSRGTHLTVQNVQPSAHILSKASSSIHQIASKIVFQSLLFGECGSATLK